ncbi:MAG: hypothetical protein HQK78_16780 [Desulfobacterales bacterium]|nr:hypothetical protein [Desulfobacterales bacterium]
MNKRISNFQKKGYLLFILIILIIMSGRLWWLYNNYNIVTKPKTSGLPIKIARYYWPGYYWKEIADKMGWFKEAGLNVELIDANSDYNKSDYNAFWGRLYLSVEI